MRTRTDFRLLLLAALIGPRGAVQQGDPAPPTRPEGVTEGPTWHAEAERPDWTASSAVEAASMLRAVRRCVSVSGVQRGAACTARRAVMGYRSTRLGSAWLGASRSKAAPFPLPLGLASSLASLASLARRARLLISRESHRTPPDAAAPLSAIRLSRRPPLAGRPRRPP